MYIDGKKLIFEYALLLMVTRDVLLVSVDIFTTARVKVVATIYSTTAATATSAKAVQRSTAQLLQQLLQLKLLQRPTAPLLHRQIAINYYIFCFLSYFQYQLTLLLIIYK